MLITKLLKQASQYRNIIYNRIRHSVCCVLIIATFLIVSPTNLYADEISNSEVKASWIYTVIDWLNWKSSPKNEKLIICAIGRDKVYMYLKRIEITSNNKKSSKQFIVQNKAPNDDLKECNMLYISDSEQEYYMNILEKATSPKGVITISSIDGFARQGGAIEFVIRKKARLIINLKVVRNAKVIIDDELYGWVETIN